MSWKNLAAVVLLFTLALLAGYFLSDSGSQLPEQRIMPVTQLQAVWCEPAIAACQTVMEEGELQMQIEPMAAIKPMRPLFATVQAPQGWLPQLLEASGLNMEMGVNRFVFKQNAAGDYQAQFLLPVCSLSRMEWQLMLTLTDGTKEVRVPFRFIIER